MLMANAAHFPLRPLKSLYTLQCLRRHEPLIKARWATVLARCCSPNGAEPIRSCTACVHKYDATLARETTPEHPCQRPDLCRQFIGQGSKGRGGGSGASSGGGRGRGKAGQAAGGDAQGMNQAQQKEVLQVGCHRQPWTRLSLSRNASRAASALAQPAWMMCYSSPPLSSRPSGVPGGWHQRACGHMHWGRGAGHPGGEEETSFFGAQGAYSMSRGWGSGRAKSRMQTRGVDEKEIKRTRRGFWPLYKSLPLITRSQVDLILCYDASASPTRQNQRMGRTARHRDGRVVYILQAPK